ncbi:MFS transporter [Motilibacter aurantiacus]|uniref:MFS transporter n=1 Tax=Motilibacter aurantiacus TaxID=2714955 RepID=UPI00140BF4F1|nr:MFS transporter [Motilibacter aurantiacus]NHC43876.1 MFS transporter [Motilibacter aurantiacus]
MNEQTPVAPAPAASGRAPAPAVAARFATAVVFLVNGTAFGSWVGRIPDVKRALELQNGELGLILLGPAVGAVLGMQLVPPAIARFGERRTLTVAALLMPLVLLPVAVAGGPVALAAALVALGAANGLLDVSMNAQAVRVERAYARPIMSSFHAWFSMGGFLGVALAGLAAQLDIGPRASLTATAVVLTPVMLAASTRLLPDGYATAAEEPGAGKRAMPRDARRRVLLLGVLAFVCLLGEGAAADWGAVYVRDERDAGPGLATAAYAAFSLCMTLGRLVGDRATGSWGPVRTVRRGAALAGAGLLAGLLLPGSVSAIAGFALLGAGLSVLVPVLFSAAGGIPGAAAGAGIARVSTLGYLGFLVGPPVIGGIAEVVGLGPALAVPALLLVGVVLAAPAVDVRGRPPAGR